MPQVKPKVKMHPSSSQSRSERPLEPVRTLVGLKDRLRRGHNPDPFRARARLRTPVQERKTNTHGRQRPHRVDVSWWGGVNPLPSCYKATLLASQHFSAN